MKQIVTVLLIVVLIVLAACNQNETPPDENVSRAVLTPAITDTPVITTSPTATATFEPVTASATPTAVIEVSITPTSSATPTSMPTDQPPTSNQSDGRSNTPNISNDGQIIAFTSTGNLTGNAPGQHEALFVRDRAAEKTELINVTLNGQAGEWPIYGSAISGNGRFVAYYSHDGNLVEGDEMDCGTETQPLSCEDLFIYDRETGVTERLPLGRGDGLGKDYTLALSEDGRYIAFGSQIYDRTNGQTTDFPTNDGRPPNGSVIAPQFAGNGTLLAFVTNADNFVPGDMNEAFDIFIWNRETNEVSRVSTAADGNDGNAGSGAMLFHEGIGSDMAISADGRFVAFASLAANLTADPIEECEDYRGYERACYNLFLHDRENGETRLITQDANQDSSSPALSTDGRFLAFASMSTSLTDDGLPECPFPAMVTCGQIYMYDQQDDQIKLISRNADGEAANQGSWLPDISADGRSIAFVSNAENLVPGDTNDTSDIFVFDQESNQVERVSLVQTAGTANSTAVQSGAALLYLRDNDLWRSGLDGQNEQRLTTGNMLADWFALDEGGDFWWTGGFPPHVHISPDGRWLAFTQTGRNLVLVDVTGQESPRIHKLEGWATIFSWAPDSQRLAYSIQPNFQLNDSQTGIFIYDVTADSFQRLRTEDGGNLVWSPDGLYLAYSCCFSESEAGPYDGTYTGDVRQVDLATQEVKTVGATWIGIASGPPPLCWSAGGGVGIDTVEPQTCSYERPYPFAAAPDGQKTAVLAARTPNDDALFRLLLLKDSTTEATFWEQEVPQVQTVYWSPDGESLFLGNSHYDVTESAVWHVPTDGSGGAQLLLQGALLIDIIPDKVSLP